MISIVHASEEDKKEKMPTRLNSTEINTLVSLGSVVAQQSSAGNGIDHSSWLHTIIELVQGHKLFSITLFTLLVRGPIASILRFYTKSVSDDEFREWKGEINEAVKAIHDNTKLTSTNMTNIQDMIQIADKNSIENSVDINNTKELINRLTQALEKTNESIRLMNTSGQKSKKQKDLIEKNINVCIAEQDVTKQILNRLDEKFTTRDEALNAKLNQLNQEYNTILTHLQTLAPQIQAINARLDNFPAQNGVAPQ
jgi:hypothetical protein